MSKIIFGFFLLIFTQPVLAQTIECNVILVSEGNDLEKTFLAPLGSKGHNVPEQSFQTKDYEITAMADGKWLGLKWTKLDGTAIAESLNLLRDLTTQPRVLLLYNPFDENAQLSMDCSKKEVPAAQ